MPHFFAGSIRTGLWRASALRLFGALLALGAWLCAAGGAQAQISPGPLSKAHQSLDGSTQCNSCHQFGASTPTFKCLECHKEIAGLLAAHKGYHAFLGMKNPNGRDCVHCHLEHNGEDFALVHWDGPVKQFDHRQAGYPLVEKHAAVACEKCHTPANMPPVQRAPMQKKNLMGSFLGLSEDCVSCHKDVHKGQLGADCQRCHNITDWKQAKQFDHSKTRYPLTGKHVQVACEKCHSPSGPEKAVKFTGIKFDSCTDCHADPHKASFKGTCESCHTTANWNKVDMSRQQFDHSKTKYPLLGMHAKVGCDQCHSGGDFKKQLAFAQCANCHTPDPHKGQFQARTSKGECAECHTVDGWKPSLFGVKEHATSKYPLEGKHVAVACEKCHTPAGKDTLYKVKFAACTDCHEDAHDKQFAAAPYQNRCEECHTVKDFHRSTFTIAKHQKTRFVLAGAHVAVACAECHKAGLGGRTDKILPFHFSDSTCTACHADPHKGEFKLEMARKRADGTALGCEACHTAKSWIDIRSFDHSKTKFALVGAHRAVPCGECHKTLPDSHEIQFKGTPKNCEACHTDSHGGQFAAKDGTSKCGDCHVDRRWAPSTFDHDKRTQFPLTGGHANVDCEKCHTLQREVQGRPVLFYKPTPKNCADCHGVDSRPA
ncbi:MAG TPA: cytochrome c3 family protein [Verrucomicrobiae bacterium]|nr:cytochrome c3 family protein [Verrucomicrobiae bacterium]